MGNDEEMYKLTKANRFALKSIRFIDIDEIWLYNLTVKLVCVLDLCEKCLKKSEKIKKGKANRYAKNEEWGNQKYSETP